MDLANLAAAALIFGQLVGGQQLQWWSLAIGVALLVTFSVISYFLRKRGR